MTDCCSNSFPETQVETQTQNPSVKPRYFVDGTKEAYEVRIELPGVARDGVQVDLNENVLTVKARRKSDVPESWKSLYRELNKADYLLRLRLNSAVDEGKLGATMENGILTLRLPLKEAAKPRRIEVS